MKFVAVLVSIFAVAWAQFLPLYPVEEERAASLGGAPVGLYRRTSDRYLPGFYPGFYPYFYPYYGRSEVSSASLGGAKVGLYERDRL
ncbi:hypothetical protein AVEN_140083-1 [Araneus ventricosus]|uniref:Uncharacterized protein n=1 Tax=Araneus ventricosus TaxID=182803 RepID=A0A4Y2SC47_ARAVE|nr:hypothetical protein AVEN_140083-1 [Araneus ventricosus]